MTERPGPAWLWRWADSEAVPERVRSGLSLALALQAEFQRVDGGLLAAAIAYYAFLSLVPLTLLAVAAASLLEGGLLVRAARDAMGDLLTAEGQAVVETAFAGDAGRGSATVVGLAVLLWGSLRVFRGVDRAFSRVYGSRSGGLLQQARDGLVVLGALAAGVVGTGLAGWVVEFLPLPPALGVPGLLAVWAAMTVALVPLYAIFPDADVGWGEALPGAALAAGAFAVLGTVFGVYAGLAGNFALYGLLGAVLLVLAWLNLVSTAVVGGAVLNAVLAGRIGEFREG